MLTGKSLLPVAVLLLPLSSVLAESPALPDSLLGTWSHSSMQNPASVTHVIQADKESDSRPVFRMLKEPYSYRTEFIDWAIYGNQLEVTFKLISPTESKDTGHRVKYSLDISQPTITGMLYNSWKETPQEVTLQKTEDTTSIAPESSSAPPQTKSHSNTNIKKGRFTLMEPAPPIKFKSIQGNPVFLEKLKGKVILLDFWATWCGPCIDEMPNVIELYSKFKGDNFEIIGISLDKDISKLNAFIAKHRMTWPQYFDGKGWDNKFAKNLGIKSIPTTVLIDKNGIARYLDLRGERLQSGVEELLKEPYIAKE